MTDPAGHGEASAVAFDVVIPALPGYGFSGAPCEPGWGPQRVGDAFDQLMTNELGYQRYGTQGGDWGSIITSRMASDHPDHVIGAHLNFILATPTPEMTMKAEAKPYLDNITVMGRDEMGYNIIPSTKPMSLGIADEWRAESSSGVWPSISVPAGVAEFPKEPARCPRDWPPSTINITRWTEMPAGGHFAALEQPQLLLQDVREFFASLGDS